MKSHKIEFWLAFFLIILHLSLSFVDNETYIKGAYFTSGIVITSKGEVLESTHRQYFNKETAYNYEMLDDTIYYSNMKRHPSLLGYVRYVVTDGNISISRAYKPLDRDISFNISYATHAGSIFTMNMIEIPGVAQYKCFYIEELMEVKCYGVDKDEHNNAVETNKKLNFSQK